MEEEFDLHVRVHPETERMVTTYTITRYLQPICYGMPLDLALKSIRIHLGEDDEEDYRLD